MEKQLHGRSGLLPHHPHSQVAGGCSPQHPIPGFYSLERVAGPLVCPPKETDTDPVQGHTGWPGMSI